MQRIVVTGALGFIGSNLFRELKRRYPMATIHGIDKGNYASDERNLMRIPGDRIVYKNDLADPMTYGMGYLPEILKSADVVFHLAASSHVDKSIEGPDVFVKDNIVATQSLLEFLRKNSEKLKRFVHVSTDEVYGDLDLNSTDSFTENSKLNPTSPYASTKASSDLIALSYHKTFKMPIVVTRCTNNYGPRQDKTKLIPKVIKCLLEDTEFPLYNLGLNKRDWLFVYDHVDGIIKTAESRINYDDLNGQVFNFGTNKGLSNWDVIREIEIAMGKELKSAQVEDRLAHDRMYRVNPKLAVSYLNWNPTVNFRDGIAKTIGWYLSNKWRLE